jgi:hypothetical protein
MKKHLLAALVILLAGFHQARSYNPAPEEIPVPPHIEVEATPRVVAKVNEQPIFENELREACLLMGWREIAQLPAPNPSARPEDIERQVLEKLIERELLFSAAHDSLSKRPEVWGKLMDYAEKEYDKQVGRMQRLASAKDEEALRPMLAGLGMTLESFKRNVVRAFVANEYARSHLMPISPPPAGYDVEQGYHRLVEELRSKAKIQIMSGQE